jgi:hypothetical protein
MGTGANVIPQGRLDVFVQHQLHQLHWHEPGRPPFTDSTPQIVG